MRRRPRRPRRSRAAARARADPSRSRAGRRARARDRVEEPEDAPAFTFDAPTGFAIPHARARARRAARTAASRPPAGRRRRRAAARRRRPQPALAADVVGEAVVHGLPFSSPRNMKRSCAPRSRAASRRRTAARPRPRTIALVGGGGAGKSSPSPTSRRPTPPSGAEVAVIALRGDTTPRRTACSRSASASSRHRTPSRPRSASAPRDPLITLIDTPAAGPSTTAAEIKALAADLKALGAEVHLALPATLSAAAADEVAAALAPLGADATSRSRTRTRPSRPGAPLELALAAGRPLSYVCSRDGAIAGRPRRAGRPAASLIMAAVTAPPRSWPRAST